ncbi:hypothetical protein C0J52_24316 [Blattella germanica]|nr:hypothetical protein C0J52_24316 [Blattella germanica]
MDKYLIVYVSSACNRTPHSADWGRNNLICYAASNSVLLYDPQFAGAGKVVSTLIEHKGRVNSVTWIKRSVGNPETELVSTSTDGTAIIWSNTGGYSFSPSILKGHQMTVTVADDIALLAYGADDAKIHLFAENVNNLAGCGDADQFVKVSTLVGHEDWIRAMDFALDDSGDLLLASSSQDALIRLWRIVPRDEQVATRVRKKISELDISEDIQSEEKIFSVQTYSDNSTRTLYFAVLLESVLAGHEGWIYGISWHPPVFSDEKKKFVQPMKLLSSSLDKTIIIWTPDEASGVWLESVRVGEMGGNTLGFYGSKFNPDGYRIMGHGYQGSFHLWSFSKNPQLRKIYFRIHFGQKYTNFMAMVSNCMLLLQGMMGHCWHRPVRQLLQNMLPSFSENKMYKLVATTDKKTGVHARIIWCCNWMHDSKYFVTASRDGKVVVWGHSGSSTDSPLGPCSVASKPLDVTNQSVTAVAVAPITLAAEMYLIAVGLETGSIVLYKWSPCAEESAVWQKCLEFDRMYPFF